jgi:hypothetical protein
MTAPPRAATPLPALLAAALALAILPACREPAPPPLPPPPDTTAFDGPAALADALTLCDFGPRAPGTPGHRHARRFLMARLTAAGLQPVERPFTAPIPGGTGTFYNIEASLPGDRSGLLLLTTHYDTIPNAPEGFVGANAAASGPAVLLELARLLAATPGRRGPEIRFLFFDGMEPLVRHGPADGLQGSRQAVRELVRAGELERIQAMINFNHVGDRDLTLTLPRNVSPSLRRVVLDAAHAENARRHLRLIPLDLGDDHDPFFFRGIPALNLIDFEYGSAPGRNDYWRTLEDTPDKLSAESLALTGRITLRTVYDLISAQ